MNPTAVVVSSILAAAATATALVFFLAPAAGRTSPAPDPGLAAIQAELSELAAAQREMVERLGAVERKANEPVERAAASPGGLDAAAVRAMIEDALAGADAPQPVDEVAQGASTLSQYEQLLALDSLFGPEAEAIWAAAAENGTLDEIVDQFRARARANPDSADDQARLGNALIQQLQRSGNPLTQSKLAMEADKAFDEALDIDEGHWDARFSKAVSYSFWPPVMSKQPEAIRHFETLVQQQQAMTSRPEFAQTYLFLGNLYDQQGNGEKAREIWQQGIQLFPADSELQQRVAR